MSEKIDYSQEVIGDRNQVVLKNLNTVAEFSGKATSLFQRQCLNDLSALMPRLRAMLNLSFDEGSKFVHQARQALKSKP